MQVIPNLINKEVSTPQAGDIVCYFNASITNRNEHSGIVIPIDEEYGILYLNGEYYLLYSPAPDAELFPAPMIPGEGGIS